MKTVKIAMYAAMMLLMIDLSAIAAQIEPLPNVSMTKADGTYISTAPGQAVLVTNTGKATLTAAGDTVVIKQGGTATIAGDNEKVYVEQGATAIVSGSGNTVYYENGSQITVTGEGSKSVQVDGFSS